MLDGYESISNEQRLLEDARLRRVTDTIYDIQHQLKLGLKPYNKLPLEPLVPIFVPDVHEDAHRLVKIVRDIDNDFFHWIDVHPEHAALGLKAIMTHQVGFRLVLDIYIPFYSRGFTSGCREPCS
ncbi:hypothetical protein D9757_011537 [Collybiopsis confluens]|uniref:Uncharacterized protein n=1 Tax=Collybiopsis confluens TaxID=2823264 RepID=A0A8H5H7I8_9AGAR|nr:hypothetical protein D9757_011537 [Collybiopsis confluens]